MTIQNGNTTESGGGIRNMGTLTSSIVSDNRADLVGGGIYNDERGTITLTNSTVKGDTASDGGGIYGPSDPVELVNTIITRNLVDLYKPDCSGSFTSLGYNLIGDAAGSAFASAPIDLVGLHRRH